MKHLLLTLIVGIALLSACSHTTIGPDWQGPELTGVAESIGNLYVTQAGFEGHPGRLVVLRDGKGPPVVIPTGLSHPEGVAVDHASGDLYLSDPNAHRLVRIVGGGSGAVGPAIDLSIGLHSPRSVAAGRNGDVYFTAEGALWKLSGGAGPPVEIATGLSDLTGVAVDGIGWVHVTGYVYNTEGSKGYVSVLTDETGPPKLIPLGATLPAGLAVSLGGVVYVVDGNTAYLKGRVLKLDRINGAAEEVAINLDHPRSVAIGAGSVYIVDRTGLLALRDFSLRLLPAQDRDSTQTPPRPPANVPQAILHGVVSGPGGSL